MLSLLLVPRLSFQLAVTTLGKPETYSTVAMAEPLPKVKKPRQSLLLDLESMAAHRSSDKQAIGIVKTKYEEMKSVNLDVVSGRDW